MVEHIKASIQGFSLAESHMSGEGGGGGGAEYSICSNANSRDITHNTSDDSLTLAISQSMKVSMDCFKGQCKMAENLKQENIKVALLSLRKSLVSMVVCTNLSMSQD